MTPDPFACVSVASIFLHIGILRPIDIKVQTCYCNSGVVNLCFQEYRVFIGELVY